MGRRSHSSAYRDMDEEFFSSLEEANYECHESPAKNKALSESTILLNHLEQRHTLRAKVILTLNLLLLAGVGTTALYSSVDASTWAMKIPSPYPMFRGSSTVNIPPFQTNFGEVFEGNDSPAFGNAILAIDGTVTRSETVTKEEEAVDDALADELDPYDEFHKAGNQLEAN
ncbi:hypothetical protein PHMEG_0007786 [Phytophthora megakarya]|uniref:Uncharacterized protein n=1 Tax=Phytophthora megakarya TaxID=4795 RepID=A0A225WKB1_9STRA|nr:hypothetical protein PHMEG_0007786 [Phytophthora megakarya]